MKMPHIFLICIILFFTFSCTSDNIEKENQTSYKLTKVVTTSPSGNIISTIEYAFDEDKKLIKVLIDGGSIKMDYSYQGNNIISTKIYTISEEKITHYAYDGDLIISDSTEILLNGQPAIFSDSFEYNANMELIVEKSFIDNILICERTFVYDTKNVASISVSCGGVSTYRYDSMKNPYQLLYNAGLSKILREGLNNKVEEKPSESNSVRTYSYEYNSQNYPVKSYTYIDNELQFINAFTYEDL